MNARKQVLESYLTLWKLRDPVLLAQTRTGSVYRVRSINRTRVLKLFSETGSADESVGSHALEFFSGSGAVEIFEHDAGAQLLEFIDGLDLTSVVHNAGDAAATRIACEVLTKLHSRKSEFPQQLRTLASWFAALTQSAHTEPLLTDGAAVARELLASPLDECVLHGDFHHENVLHHKLRGWLSIDPKGLVGESTFDAANLLYNPAALPELTQDKVRCEKMVSLVAESLALPIDRFRKFAFAYGCLSACWSQADRDDPAPALRIAAWLREGI